MKYAPGKVPTNPLPAAPKRPGIKPTVTGASNLVVDKKPPPPLPIRPAPPMPAKPVGPGIKPTVRGVPAPRPSGPMVPVRGGGMAPASVATMMKKGGKVSSASKRADGIAAKGKTKGKIV